MRYSSSLLALAAVTIGQAAAGILSHRHFHARRSPLEVTEYVPSPYDLPTCVTLTLPQERC
jgi:hypothetical protein